MRISIKSLCKFGVLLVWTVVVTVVVFRYLRDPPLSSANLPHEKKNAIEAVLSNNKAEALYVTKYVSIY